MLRTSGFGGTGSDAFIASATDGVGSIVVGGSSRSDTMSLGCGPLSRSGQMDGVVGKLSPDGSACLWSHRSVGATTAAVTGVGVDGSGDVIASGWFTGGPMSFGGDPVVSAGSADPFVVKLSGADGSQQWLVAGAGSGWDNVLHMAMATDGSGDAFVVGSTRSDDFVFGQSLPNPFPGNRQAIVARITGSTGAVGWSKVFAGSGAGFNQTRAVAVDASSNLIVAGYFESPTISFGGPALANTGSRDAFAAKLSGVDGGHLWSTSAVGAGTDSVEAVSSDALGSVFITGGFGSGTFDWGAELTNSDAGGGVADTFVTKLGGQSGAHSWSIGSSSEMGNQGAALATLPDGSIMVAGSFAGATFSLGASGEVLVGTGGQDAWLVKLRGLDGGHVFSLAGDSQTSGALSDEGVGGVCVNPTGTAIVAGSFNAEQLRFDVTQSMTNSAVDTTDGFLLLVR